MYFFNRGLENPFFNWLMPIFDHDRNWILPLVVLWVLVMIFGNRRTRFVGICTVLVLLLTDPISSQVIKPLVGRIRPCNLLANLHLYIHGGWVFTPDPIIEIYRSSRSFPSSHATNIGGQAMLWAWAFPRLQPIWWVIACTVGTSRIIIGIHWPSDVLAGWALGALLAYLVIFGVRRWGPKEFRKSIKSGS